MTQVAQDTWCIHGLWYNADVLPRLKELKGILMGSDTAYDHNISEHKMAHVRAVAEMMYDEALARGWGEDKAEDMYLLGFIHDIGYMLGPDHHAKSGSAILKRSMYAYAWEVRMHGTYVGTPSPELELLWLCDLSIDSCGNRCSTDERLEHVGERFGKESPQYHNVSRIVQHLRSHGLADAK